ncbi:hypothetical protein RvY_10549 [Ramazzottius varieornatus]|uniref:Uncharacterized protein n=1 Tax=Ramazzottius varieornatus TaxID=947166 RepID=A0A1D1VD40_RAMVA|nr:hypothetical protein RvY_10549 [Ramazzottius varieornatus]
MDYVAEGFVSIQNKSDVVWLRTLPGHPKSANRTFVFTTTESTRVIVERFGDIAMEVADKHNIPVWTSAHDVALAKPHWYRDQVHPGPRLLEIVSIVPYRVH